MSTVRGQGHRKLIVVAPQPIGWVTDVAAVAAARRIAGRDIDVLLVNEPPIRYRLRCQSQAAAETAVQQLTNLCCEQLEALPEEQRVWWLTQHADALHKVEQREQAADLYRRVAETGMWPYAAGAALNYGLLLKEVGSIDQARQYFLRALEAGVDEVAGQAAMLLGFDAHKRQDDASARNYFARAISFGEPKGAQSIALMDQMEERR